MWKKMWIEAWIWATSYILCSSFWKYDFLRTYKILDILLDTVLYVEVIHNNMWIMAHLMKLKSSQMRLQMFQYAAAAVWVFLSQF